MPSSYISEALGCYKKCDTDKYVEMAELAVVEFCKEGRISQAARLMKDMGEQMEESADMEKAAKCYKEAGKLYEKENQPSQANQNWIKAADISCTLREPDWGEIQQIYQNVIKDYLKKDMLRSSAKPLMLKCCLCALANRDAPDSRKKFTNFSSEDPGLNASREGEFIQAIIDSSENNSKDMFDKAVADHTRITPFHKTETAILATIADGLSTGAGASKITVQNEDELKLDDDDLGMDLR